MVPSTYVPVALSCVVAPDATDAVAGVIASEICAGETTSREAVPPIPASFAVMVAAPTPCPVATPDDTVAITAVLLVVAEVADQLVSVLTSCVEPSLKVPAAENARFPPGATNAVDGFTAID